MHSEPGLPVSLLVHSIHSLCTGLFDEAGYEQSVIELFERSYRIPYYSASPECSLSRINLPLLSEALCEVQ